MTSFSETNDHGERQRATRHVALGMPRSLMFRFLLTQTALHNARALGLLTGTNPSFLAPRIRGGICLCGSSVFRGSSPTKRPRQRRCAGHLHRVAAEASNGGRVQLTRSESSADSSADGCNEEPFRVEPMAMLYQEWTLDQDRQLWENRHLPVASLASVLGRGLRGVEKRLEKLKDVESSAYQRLFVSPKKQRSKYDGASSSSSEEARPSSPPEGTKLVPVSEVLRRVRYDPSIPSEKFTVLYYDRVEDAVMESPLMAPNTSIRGPNALWVDALPEHRIQSIKYLERVVWDKESRLDVVFSDPGLVSVIASYDEWNREREEEAERTRQRQREVSARIERALGGDLYLSLLDLLRGLQEAAADPTLSTKLESERFVQASLELFAHCPDVGEAIDLMSELVALHPDPVLREAALTELSRSLDRDDPTKPPRTRPVGRLALPELREEDLAESFVRGSGPGGQKINKTSSRVVLVHVPTQIRVECQETRSLHQNRKLARRRLQLKLDEHLNGSQSVERVKASIASAKKGRAKARSRARQRRKQAAKEGEEG